MKQVKRRRITLQGYKIGALILLSFLCIHAKAVDVEKSNSIITIKGVVKDKTSGEVLSSANLFIKELKKRTATNEEGEYSFEIPKGTYSLHISYIGYKGIKTILKATASTTLDFELTSNSELKEVLVTSKRKDENISKVEMGVQKLSITEIRKMPALMGEIDVIKSIQMLPGVQSTSEGSSGYSVRGGSADQNLILLDNVNVYNASHMFGFFSVFNNDVVKSAELYKGNLPMRYGGRLSSLLDVQLKDDQPKKITGSGGIGLISSRLSVEGPLGSKTSWIISGRRSYADLFLKLSSDKEKKETYLYFYDVNAKITHTFSEKDKLSLSLYSGKDVFGASVGSFDYGNSIGSIAWNHAFSENLFSNVSLEYTGYHYSLGSKMENSQVNWESNIYDFGIHWDLKQVVNKNLELEYGISSTQHTFNPGLITRPAYPDYKMQKTYALEHSIYIGAEQKITDRISAKYGIRETAFQNMGEGLVYTYDQNHNVADSTSYGKGKIYHTYFAMEPRVGFVYKLNNESSLKANFAHNTQFIQLANNSASGSPLDIWFSASPNVKPQTADLYSVGYFRNFKDNAYELSAELYYKDLDHVIDFADHAQLLLNDKLEGEIRTGTGKAYGIELMIKKNIGRLTGFINYTLSRSERTIPGINDGKSYLSPTDKTHAANILVAYELSKKWSFSAAWVYATGTPITYPTGRFELNGEYFPIYSSRNKYRKADYHRLDISATYTPVKNPKRFYQGEWNFSLYNAYWNKNPWMISYDQNTGSGIPQAQMTYLFGAIPSITYNFKF